MIRTFVVGLIAVVAAISADASASIVAASRWPTVAAQDVAPLIQEVRKTSGRPKTVAVRSYKRKSGTVVAAHKRAAPVRK